MNEELIFEAAIEPTLAAAADYAQDLREQLIACGHGAEEADCWRLAAAEAVNNIVVHGLAGRADGAIHACLRVSDKTTRLELTDNGLTMPSGRLEAAVLSPPGVDLSALPESGWGLGLIKSCVDRCRYSRLEGRNRLTLERRRGASTP